MIAQVLTAVAATTLASSPPPNLPGFLNVVAPYLEHYGYWAVLLLVMIEDFGVPVPGETVLIAAAIFAGAGRLNVVVVGLVGFVAAIIGDNIGFSIGHYGGRALALRWGKYVFLTEERLTKAEVFFNRHGGKIIVVARFIEGLRQANGIIAGLSGMRWWRFVVFNALGAALWVGTWVSLGYLAGDHINTIYHYITAYSLYALIALGVLLAALVIRHVLRHRAAREPRDTVEPSSRAVRHEDSEAIGQYGAQEAAAIQETTAIQDAAQTEDAAGIHDRVTPPDSVGTGDGTAIPEGAQTPDGAAGQYGTAIPEGAQTPDGAAGQYGTAIPEGAESQESAKTQSS